MAILAAYAKSKGFELGRYSAVEVEIPSQILPDSDIIRSLRTDLIVEFSFFCALSLGKLVDYLVTDIQNLTCVSCLLSAYNEKASETQLQGAVETPLAEIFRNMPDDYVALRLQGNNMNDAFDKALEPVADLLQRIQTGSIVGHELFPRIATYLAGVARRNTYRFGQPVETDGARTPQYAFGF